MADFTDRRINQTYKRLVQVDNGTLQNGLGVTLSGSMGNLTVSGALAITGYPNVSASISRLEYFSSSLDATYATDQQLSDVSSSLALETAQLLDFSASLDATFATDAQLSSVSSSFSDTITVIKQDAQYDSGRIGALEAKRLVSSSRQITGALDTIYPRKDFISGAFDITSASLASRFDNLDANYATDAQLIAQSSSFSDTISVIKQDAQYDSGRIGALEAKRLVSSSRQITGALDTIYPRTTIAGISGSGNIYSASFALNINSLTAATSSYALKTQITGSFDALSGSLSTRLTTIQNDAQYDSGRIGALEAKRLVSSSRQITGALDTIYPRTTNAAISGSSDSRFAVLNAATSSYAAKSEITGSFAIESSRIDTLESVVSASVLLNLTPVDPLPSIGVNTGSLAVTGSTLAYYDGNNWKVIATGSTLPL